MGISIPHPLATNPPGEQSRARLLRFLALVALLPVFLATTCSEGGSQDLIHVTLNAIPPDQNDLLVVPPSGFTVDVTFPQPSQVDPQSLWLGVIPFNGSGSVDLINEVVRADPTGAVAVIPPRLALAVGSHTAIAWVLANGGAIQVATLAFAVRNHALGPPLATIQWVQLDFEADRDGDLLPDFPDDLLAFGLGSTGAPVESDLVHDWVVTETVSRAQAYYDTPNPSQLPAGDPIDLFLSDLPPGSGAFTRICVAGEDPSGGSTLGNVAYDAGNANPSDVACDDFSPSGVFPRELLIYSGQSAFQTAFDPLLLEPVGTHALDATVLGPGYDPGNPAQYARFTTIETGVETFAQALASIVAHESGHAIGLVPPGDPGGGLFGGGSGQAITHNLTPTGAIPSENLLMNQGSSFQFRDLIGAEGSPLPRLRELNFAYLRGRLVLDAAVTGIFPAPLVDMDPVTLLKSGPSLVPLTITGLSFLDPPSSIRLLGPVVNPLFAPQFVSETEVTGQVLLPLVPVGSYDVEVTNHDGQVAVQLGVVTVDP